MHAHILKLSDADYFARSEMSKHTLDDFIKNPFAFFERRKNGIVDDSDTDARRFGRLVHAAILEPRAVSASYAVQPADIKRRAGTAWEAFRAENEGKEIVKADEFSLALGLADAVVKSDEAAKVLTLCTEREFSVIWEETSNGTKVPMRAKVDFASDSFSVIGDLKTTSDASPDAFMKDCDAYGYDIQAAIYLSALRAAGHTPKCFAFVVVEKDFPFTTAIYTFDADSDFVLAGDLEFRSRLSAYVAYSAQDAAGLAQKGWQEHNLPLPPWSKRLKNLQESIINQNIAQ